MPHCEDVGVEQRFVDANPHYLRWDLSVVEPEIVPIDFYASPAVNQHGVLGGAKLKVVGQTPILYSDHVTHVARLANSLNARPTVITKNGNAAGISEAPGSLAAVRWDCAG